MYGGIGNSLLVGCLMKWPWLIPAAMFGVGGLVYESCFDGSSSSTPIIPPPTVVVPAEKVTPVVVVPLVKPAEPVATPTESPAPVTTPQPLPPKKVKG